ncbi:MAG: hypothetical protein Q7W55_12860 [Pseudohongiella sp.]|nr:hypothetical protein [Pseudohongiella sp.]MDO9518768.1 hypothetical protein [Pseudohongiella sp.]MDP2128935.1 hypothetical protein [Pseudohongiella sp.]
MFATCASLIFALPDMYRGSTTVLLGQDAISDSVVGSGNIGQLEQRLHVIRQELLGREQLIALIQRFNLYEGWRDKVPTATLLDRMRKDIHISQSVTSQVSLQRGQSAPMQVRIGYQGWSPEEVAEVSNALADIYREKYEGIRIDQASRTTDFLRGELEDVAKRMREQEEQIDAFRSANLGQLPQQEGMNLATLERLNSDLRINGERQMQLQNRRSEIQAGEFRTVAGIAGESRLELLRRELAVMRTRYSERHPGMIRLQEEINQLEQQAVQAEESGGIGTTVSVAEEFARLRREENALRESIASMQLRLQLSPEIGQRLAQMSNTYNAIREEHLVLQRRFQDARLAESLESQQTRQFQVLELALPPDFSSAPNRPRLLVMAFVLSCAAIFALIFIVEQLTQTFYSSHDLRSFSSLPVLASIRHIETTGARVKNAATSVIVLLIYVLLLLAAVGFIYSNGLTAKGLVWLVAGNYV